MPRNRAGLLIVRAWLETGSSKPLRANIRFTTDVSLGFQHAINLAEAEDIGALVRAWLRDIEADGVPELGLLAD